MLTPEQAFRYGFLRRCAEEGLDDDEADGRLKRAQDAAAIPGGVASAMGGFGLGALKAVGGLGLDAAKFVGGHLIKSPLYAVGGAMGLGAGGGYLLAKAREGTLDPETAQKDETIEAYRAYADQVEQRNRLRRAPLRRPHAFKSR